MAKVSDVVTMQARKETFKNRSYILSCLLACEKGKDLSYGTVIAVIDANSGQPSCRLDRSDGPAYLKRKLEAGKDLEGWVNRITNWPTGSGVSRATQEADPEQAAAADLNEMLRRAKERKQQAKEKVTN